MFARIKRWIGRWTTPRRYRYLDNELQFGEVAIQNSKISVLCAERFFQGYGEVISKFKTF